MVAASFNPTTVAANVVAILVGFVALARYGQTMFRKAVKEEVKPALDALERHTVEAVKGQKKLKKQQAGLADQFTEHRANDDIRFDHDDEQSEKILARLLENSVRLDHTETQGTEAAEKVVTLATAAAERVATVAANAAIQAEKVAIGTAEAAKLVATQAAKAAEANAATVAERVAETAASKAVALIEAAHAKAKLDGP